MFKMVFEMMFKMIFIVVVVVVGGGGGDGHDIVVVKTNTWHKLITIHNNTLHNTLQHTTPHHTTVHYTTLHNTTLYLPLRTTGLHAVSQRFDQLSFSNPLGLEGESGLVEGVGCYEGGLVGCVE